jgi:hypothetical protein
LPTGKALLWIDCVYFIDGSVRTGQVENTFPSTDTLLFVIFKKS